MSFLQILFISWFVEFYTISDGQILYLLGHSLLDCSIQPSCSYFIWYQVSLFCCKKYCKTVERTTKKCHFKNCIGWLLLFYFVEITLRDMCVSMDVCIVSEKNDEWNDKVWFKKREDKEIWNTICRCYLFCLDHFQTTMSIQFSLSWLLF